MSMTVVFNPCQKYLHLGEHLSSLFTWFLSNLQYLLHLFCYFEIFFLRQGLSLVALAWLVWNSHCRLNWP